ncbi:Ketopantoate hydroxymethyltransferase [Ignavibacterium album JCM 16511]|uniref:3-methyl-2-oxobutanoate hydroxymethyltransferase n=1 Tax=Ignavibacterium album (strain DSM 19864 / JCM 16511 / NBRC 101810 / Mat9-16) TaxID=945713 RepID=I0AFM0_IGNAJ|nr:3-methyl-2-oxobutanoate hydroxymethyltransferase [Ignavibacterium album]AFH47777.1 Ketopantoate hydroxymethyltransferase [Ignavibacterium album JCM 16511]
MKSILEFQKKKQLNIPISMVTCYDYWSAQIVQETNIDAVLVGDSAAMVMHGYETTINADVNMMLYHISAVRKGIGDKLLVADFPFLAHRKGKKFAMNVVDDFMKCGANAIKIEGAGSTIKLIKYIVESGVPVMGHLGLTPQSVNSLGGFTLQGVNKNSSEKILNDAKELEDAGCFSIVLEMIPAKVAKLITNNLSVPTIGIGAGKYTSGQILVLQDLLGFTKNFNPRFLRKYMEGYDLVKNALNKYDKDVKQKNFPSAKESY